MHPDRPRQRHKVVRLVLGPEPKTAKQVLGEKNNIPFFLGWAGVERSEIKHMDKAGCRIASDDLRTNSADPDPPARVLGHYKEIPRPEAP